MTDDITEFIRASRERITEITSDASDIWMQGSLKDLTLANYARTALPRALDIIEAQQEQIDAADRSLASMLRDIGKYHDRIAEQQAEIVRLRDQNESLAKIARYNAPDIDPAADALVDGLLARARGSKP